MVKTEIPQNKIGKFEYFRKSYYLDSTTYIFNGKIGVEMVNLLNMRHDFYSCVYGPEPSCAERISKTKPQFAISIYQVIDSSVKITTESKQTSLEIYNLQDNKRRRTLKALESVFK